MENLLVILSAVLGSYVTYYFTNRSKKNEAILRFKEEKYSNLLILLQGFIGNTASAETKKKFLEEYYRSWIYSSDGVIKSINEMLNLVRNSGSNKAIDHDLGRKSIGNIALQMRKDLLGGTKLDFKYFEYLDIIK